MFLPLTKSVSLTEARYCVHAGFVVVDILIKLVVFHEEKLVEQFGSEVFLLVEHHAEFVHIRDLTTLGLGESEHCDDLWSPGNPRNDCIDVCNGM